MMVYLVRHPEPVGATGVCYGRHDLDAKQEAVVGVAEFVRSVIGMGRGESAPDSMVGRDCDVADGEGSTGGRERGRGRHAEGTSGFRIVSSPLRRCAALASTLSEAYEMDDRLVEMSFGDWESKKWGEIDRGELDAWAEDYVECSPPGGESWGQVQSRARLFLDDLRVREERGHSGGASVRRQGGTESPVVVVTHVGVIRAILSIVIGIPLVATWNILVPYGSVVGVDLTAEADALVGLFPYSG